ncbi:hypothetical protein EHE21_11030 [Proteus sp. GOKU]|uniref:hypothetical protein n=1 Tax=Proteus TaxID=583 RepID=UPI001892CE53|nr:MULTISPECIES: hypothetical protein [Proteus]QPB79885.1 hypothetical protein EHE21_11030 [Proteus sp. GOKU]QQP25892.1 hypothetical protein D7029_11030 [Proteus vulgaris]
MSSDIDWAIIIAIISLCFTTVIGVISIFYTRASLRTTQESIEKSEKSTIESNNIANNTFREIGKITEVSVSQFETKIKNEMKIKLENKNNTILAVRDIASNVAFNLLQQLYYITDLYEKNEMIHSVNIEKSKEGNWKTVVFNSKDGTEVYTIHRPEMPEMFNYSVLIEASKVDKTLTDLLFDLNMQIYALRDVMNSIVSIIKKDDVDELKEMVTTLLIAKPTQEIIPLSLHIIDSLDLEMKNNYKFGYLRVKNEVHKFYTRDNGGFFVSNVSGSSL